MRAFRTGSLWPLLLAVGLVACGTSESAQDESGRVTLARPRSEAVTSQGWLNVKTLQLQSATQVAEDGDLVVEGVISGWYFHPTSDIKAPIVGQPPAATRPCWLELLNRRIHYRDAGGPPKPPYLPGEFDAEHGLFYPSQQTVVRPGAAPAPDRVVG